MTLLLMLCAGQLVVSVKSRSTPGSLISEWTLFTGTRLSQVSFAGASMKTAVWKRPCHTYLSNQNGLNTSSHLDIPPPHDVRKSSMDAFRSLVKTFQPLDEPPTHKIAQDACSTFAHAAIDKKLAWKIKMFVDDHLTPARFENTGTELGRRQGFLQETLEQVSSKVSQAAADDDVGTIRVASRLSQNTVGQSTSTPDPQFADALAVPGPSAVIDQSGGNNNIFHSWRTQATNASSSSEPAAEQAQSLSQLEQVYAWGGAEAARGLLELDDTQMSARHVQRWKVKQRRTGDEAVCRDLSERYGGVWIAPKLAGKGAPARGYGSGK